MACSARSPQPGSGEKRPWPATRVASRPVPPRHTRPPYPPLTPSGRDGLASRVPLPHQRQPPCSLMRQDGAKTPPPSLPPACRSTPTSIARACGSVCVCARAPSVPGSCSRPSPRSAPREASCPSPTVTAPALNNNHNGKLTASPKLASRKVGWSGGENTRLRHDDIPPPFVLSLPLAGGLKAHARGLPALLVVLLRAWPGFGSNFLGPPEASVKASSSLPLETRVLIGPAAAAASSLWASSKVNPIPFTNYPWEARLTLVSQTNPGGTWGVTLGFAHKHESNTCATS